MPEIKRFNQGTLKKYMQTPDSQWVPIKSPDDVHSGMVIRSFTDPNDPLLYLYVTTDTPVGGYHILKPLGGSSTRLPTSEIRIMPSAFPKRYHQFVGPTSADGLPLTTTAPQEEEPTQPPAAPAAPTAPAAPAAPAAPSKGKKKIDVLKEEMAAIQAKRKPPEPESPPKRKSSPKSKSPPKPSEEKIQTEREATLAAELEKERKAEELAARKALKTLDKEKVKEETKLLQAACFALAHAFGEAAPEACDTIYAKTVSDLATDVVLGKISHNDAIASIVATVRADAESKGLAAIATPAPAKGAKKHEDRIDQVEKDIKHLDAQVTRMATHLESVLKRWESIAPKIPTNTIKYFEAPRAKRSTPEGSTIGVMSYTTGEVEKIRTTQTPAEIKDGTILSITNGLCIHFNQSNAEGVHAAIADAMGVAPENLWGYDFKTKEVHAAESEEEGFAFVRCFTLSRSSGNAPFHAAGGRLAHPSVLVSSLKQKYGDSVLIVVPEGVVLA